MDTVKYYGSKSHAKRRLETLAVRFPAVNFIVDQGFGGFCVSATLTAETAAQRSVLESDGVAVVMPPVEEVKQHEEKTVNDTAEDAAKKVAEAKAAEAAKKEADKTAKKALADEAKAAKKKEREARQTAAAESRREVAKIKAEEKARKAAEPKAEKTQRATGESSSWKENWDKAPAALAKKVSEGKPAFRPGSKRDLLLNAMNTGITLDAAMTLLDWNKATVSSSFHELAYLTGRKVVKTGEGEAAVYALEAA